MLLELRPNGSRIETGDWRLETGEWGMGNEKWRMENGEWRMKNEKWRMENGEWRMEICTTAHRFPPGSSRWEPQLAAT
jgi:hypothetical protein